jgi:hypothetical protein
MYSPSQIPDEAASLPRRQRGIDHLLNQFVAEQRDPSGLFRPATLLAIDIGHLVDPFRHG